MPMPLVNNDAFVWKPRGPSFPRRSLLVPALTCRAVIQRPRLLEFEDEET